MREKKERNESSRRSVQDKIRAALQKKPNAAILSNLSAEKLNEIVTNGVSESKQKLIKQRHIRNSKQKRFANRPVSAGQAMLRQPFEEPHHRLFNTPDWFSNTQPVDVSIIIPCFKSQEVLPEQINSWDLSDDGLSKEIIYVDDACPMKSHLVVLQEWEKKKAQLKSPVGKIVVNGRNAGFAFACNVGARHASGKYLIFLNADTKVTPNWVRPMYETLADPSIGLVGNLHLKEGGKVDSCGSEWHWKSQSFLHVGRNIYHGKMLDKAYHVDNLPDDLKQPHDVEMVTGACMMMPKAVFDEVGGFDTEYRIGYWEDSDLNMRVHAHGYRVHFQPNSIIYHKVGHTHSGAHAYMGENKNIFHRRWVQTKIIDGYLNSVRPNHQKIEVPENSTVIYTAITRNYDHLKEQPLKPGVDFVAFLESPVVSKTWQYRAVHNEFSDSNRNAKIHKILSHRYFPDKLYSLWIDGSVTLDFPFSLERLIEIYLTDCDLAVFKHPERNCIYQEANVCIQRRLDDPDVIRQQIQRYTREGYPSNVGLVEATVLLRRHTEKVIEFNEAWWEEICKGSKRDQISFNYVARKLNLKYRYFPGNLRQKNYLFVRDAHAKYKR